MLISEIDTLFKEIFKNDLVKSVDTTYEKSGDGLKLVISIHGLSIQDTIIIHTKFMFHTDNQKINITKNEFHYLYDINCIYRIIDFNDPEDLKNKVKKIIKHNKFGINIQILSEFIDNSPARTLNKYFNDNNVVKYSVDNVNYEPKFKMQPCDETTFDFDISVSNKYNIKVIISKGNDPDEENRFKFRFRLLNDSEEVNVKELKNISSLIGGKIIEILDNFLK